MWKTRHISLHIFNKNFNWVFVLLFTAIHITYLQFTRTCRYPHILVSNSLIKNIRNAKQQINVRDVSGWWFSKGTICPSRGFEPCNLSSAAENGKWWVTKFFREKSHDSGENSFSFWWCKMKLLVHCMSTWLNVNTYYCNWVYLV